MNHFRAVSIISKIIITANERENLQTFYEGIKNDLGAQREFFEYCKKWKLAPWVYIQLKRNDCLHFFYPQTITLFQQQYATIKEDNEKRNKEAVRFLKAFVENGIDVVILKGNLLAHTVYQEAGYKRMNDFDILIKEQDWDRIQDIYFSLGYIPLGFGWSGEKQKAAKFSHVGMAFISPDFSCIIGSQWGLKSPTTSFKVNINDVWKTAVEFDFLGVKVKQLSPEYNMLHLILHMGIFKCGIRDCMDVYNLALSVKLDDEKLIKILSEANALEKGYFTLAISNLCGNDFELLLSKFPIFEKSFVSRRLEKRLQSFKECQDIHDSYNDYFQDVEKEVIYFNLFPEFHKRCYFYFRILKKIGFVKNEMALKLSDATYKPSLLKRIKAQLKAPYYVFALIAQEIGWTFTTLLFVKLFFDVIFSLKNYMFKKESYFDYLRTRNIDPDLIQKAVKNIQ